MAGAIRQSGAQQRPEGSDSRRSRRRGQLRCAACKMEGSACHPASGRNQVFLWELGVDEPIDYEKTRFEDVVHDVDVVFDTLGGDTQNRSWEVLKQGGILVSIVAAPSAEEAAKHGVRSAFFSAQPSSSQLSEIAKLVDAGKLKPVVETVLPLSDARRAHELNETGHATGKTVLKVA
jgi:NADPH:quinone reductase-like Zn-dependent oxidoreductase